MSALKISTSGHSQGSSSSYTNVPSLVAHEKLKDWQISLDSLLLVVEESEVREFFNRNWSHNQQAVSERKTSTFCSWRHKQARNSLSEVSL